MTIDKLNAHPLSNYLITERESQPEEDPSVASRLKRLEEQYNDTGIRKGVEALMVVMDHGFPHVLVLQVANAFYKLPGGYLDPSESDEEGLITRLNEQLGVPLPDGKGYAVPEGGQDWKAKECLNIWWRPNFDTFSYPYLPPHVSFPKECRKSFLVTLPEHKTFAVPLNMKLHAIPILEFYDNAARYGPQFAGIPYILSRYWLDQHSFVMKCAESYAEFEACKEETHA